jgi:hypothetical protein
MSEWHIRGISEEARRSAKVAAALDGMTLGKWLERVIETMAAIGPGNFKVVPAAPENPERGTLTVEAVRIMKEQLQDDHPPKLPRKVKTCAHGEAKGNNCWQCGGLAVVEEK